MCCHANLICPELLESVMLASVMDTILAKELFIKSIRYSICPHKFYKMAIDDISIFFPALIGCLEHVTANFN